MGPDKKTILLAEDNDDDVFLLRHILKRTCPAHQVRHVRNGTEAIKYLERQPPFDDLESYPPPSLLVLDIKMPEQDGFDVLKWMRQSGVNLPVVVLSQSLIPR